MGNRGVRLASDLENIDQVDPKWLSLGSEMYDPITCLSDGSCPNAIAAGVKDPYPGFSGALQQALRPYPQYLGINSNNLAEDAFSSYNALQISAQRRYTSGLTTLVSYTGSKQIGDTASGFTTFSAGPINAFNRKAEKAINATDVPQMLTIAGIYELPVGPGKHFATRGGAVGKVIGGWQLGYILRYTSGSPESVCATNLLPIWNTGCNRPNVVPGVPKDLPGGGFDPAVDKEFNIAAFSQPADYTIGNAAHYLPDMRTFPYEDEDLSLIKYTTIHEKTNLEFRFETFNAFNRVQFSGGNTSYSPSNPSFGVVGGQANLPRKCQLSLKLNF